MKRLMPLILCVLLSACAKVPDSDYVPSSENTLGEIHTDTDYVPHNDDTVEEPLSDFNYALPDYSAHGETYADEEMYITELADLKMLSSGKQTLAWEIEPADWSASVWDGENNVLKEYLMNREVEVVTIMMSLFNDEQIMKTYWKDMENTLAHKKDRETAERLIKKGKMSLEDIADCVPALSFDELKEIETEVMQLA